MNSCDRWGDAAKSMTVQPDPACTCRMCVVRRIEKTVPLKQRPAAYRKAGLA